MERRLSCRRMGVATFLSPRGGDWGRQSPSSSASTPKSRSAYRTIPLPHLQPGHTSLLEEIPTDVENRETPPIRGAGGGQTPIPTIAQPLESRKVVTVQIPVG